MGEIAVEMIRVGIHNPTLFNHLSTQNHHPLPIFLSLEKKIEGLNIPCYAGIEQR